VPHLRALRPSVKAPAKIDLALCILAVCVEENSE
jgi:hypothetical protein